jgi:hypothetical protein
MFLFGKEKEETTSSATPKKQFHLFLAKAMTHHPRLAQGGL